MNSVSVDGKNYVKAKVLARNLGYTGDYVGQLCRAGKVDAQLVGRSWYVNEESLKEHKQGRYRSNAKETIKVFERTLKATDADVGESTKVGVHVAEGGAPKSTKGYARESFYNRAATSNQSATYHTDQTELIPGKEDMVRSGSLGVRLADAHNVSVSSKNKTFDFDPTEREVLKFKGTLHVSDVPDEPDEEPADSVPEEVVEEPVASAPKPEHKPYFDEKANKIKVKHRRPTTKRKVQDLPLERNAEGVVGMQRQRIVSRNPQGGTLRVNAPVAAAEASRRITPVLLIITTVTAIFIGVLVTSVQQITVIENGAMVSTYTLDFAKKRAAAFSAFE